MRGGGGGTCGDGRRMRVPFAWCTVLMMERKAAEVDWIRFGGENGSALVA